MLRNAMQPNQAAEFQTWVSGEWARCSAIRGTLEDHAITYLVTANGGGAAAVIAFSGSAHFANAYVYIALGLFIAGLVLTGLGIWYGLHRMTWITKELGSDHRSFNMCQLDSVLLDERHQERFGRRSYGTTLGVSAFLCFIVGTIMSAWSYQDYIKAEAVAAEKARGQDLKEMAAAISQATILSCKGQETRAVEVEQTRSTRGHSDTSRRAVAEKQAQ